MEKIYEEVLLKDSQPPKLLEETELKYMKSKICRISAEKKIGTGFFCKIKYNNELVPVLMTNYHIISDDYLEKKKKITIYVNDIAKIIKTNKRRKLYSNKSEYDIMIIKLSEDDELNNDFLEIAPNIYEKNWEDIYKNEMIYVLHFPQMKGATISSSEFGIEKKDEYTIMHKCNTEEGSSGGPIINAMNNKVLGIHKGGIKSINGNQINIGTLLKYPLNKLNDKNNIIKEEIIIEDDSLSESKSNLISNTNTIDNIIINEPNNIKILEKLPIEDYTNFSYLLIGDSNSGKNEFLNKLDEYIKQKKLQTKKSSMDFNLERVIPIQFQDKIYSIQFIDCSIKFQIVAKSYYHFANSFIIFYNISDKKTFDNVENWIDDIYDFNENAKITLIGNKISNKKDREISYEKTKKFTKRNKIKFYEIRNVTENNIKEILFNSLNEENNNEEEKEIKLIDNFSTKSKIKCI